MIRGGATIFAHEFPVESAFFPLVVDFYSEGFSKTAAIIGRYFLIEKCLFPSINFLMPELYAVEWYAVIKQIKERSRTVLASRKTDDVFIVAK